MATRGSQSLPATTSAIPPKADHRRRKSAFVRSSSAVPLKADPIRTTRVRQVLTQTRLSWPRRRSLFQLLQHRLCIPQIGCVEALGEPVVDWRHQLTRIARLTWVPPQPGERSGGAQLPVFSYLRPSDIHRSAIGGLSGYIVARELVQIDLDAMSVGQVPAVAGALGIGQAGGDFPGPCCGRDRNMTLRTARAARTAPSAPASPPVPGGPPMPLSESQRRVLGRSSALGRVGRAPSDAIQEATAADDRPVARGCARDRRRATDWVPLWASLGRSTQAGPTPRPGGVRARMTLILHGIIVQQDELGSSGRKTLDRRRSDSDT